MTEYLTSNVIEKFKHGFFKRTGGVSIGEFSSLNCKYSSFDTISKINSNRALVSNLMGIKTTDLITCHPPSSLLPLAAMRFTDD